MLFNIIYSIYIYIAVKWHERYDSTLEKYDLYVDKTIDYIPKRWIKHELLIYTDKKDKTNS